MASRLRATARLPTPLTCRCLTSIPAAATEPAQPPVTSKDSAGAGAAAQPLGQGLHAAAGRARVTTVPGGRARGDFLQAGFPAAPGGLRMAISLPKMQTEIKGTEGTGEKSIAFGESEGHSWLM